MEAIFLKLLNMSITASWLVLVIIILRCLLLKKASKAITAATWALAGIRLILPFSVESIFSLIPSTETIPYNIIYSDSPSIQSGISSLNNAVNPLISGAFAGNPVYSANPMHIIVFYASLIWIAGIITMLLYTVISYIRIYRKVRESIPYDNNIMICDQISTPFIFGIISPKIYLPSSLNDQDTEYVIAHEKAHLKRRDYLWKPIGFMLLTVYWFNPILWAAYILLCRDIELACDEKVIMEMGIECKKHYSNALINCSVPRRAISACPLAFGETGVKLRIKSILNYRKPAFWIIILSVVLCLATSVAFLTNPKTPKWESEKYGLFCNVISAECNDIIYEYSHGTIDNDTPNIGVNWINNTNDILCFGNKFVLYKDDKIYEPKAENYFNAELHTVKPGEKKSESYTLSSYDLQEGSYRLEKTFYLESNPDIKYRAFLNFSVEKTYSFTGVQYKGEKIIYDCGSFSSIIYTDESIPQFLISGEDLSLLTNDNPASGLSSSFYKINSLQKIRLTKSNFDDLMTSQIWDSGYSAKALRRDNLNAFSALDLNSGRMYYLLEQKTGEIYIAQGYTDTNTIRWIFKMNVISSPAG